MTISYKITLGVYQHYKGAYYQIIGIARHSETLEELVVYQSLYGDFGLWVRPASMFLEKVSHNGDQVDRFRFLDEGIYKVPEVR